MTDLDRLRALAEGATPGPWRAGKADRHFHHDSCQRHRSNLLCHNIHAGMIDVSDPCSGLDIYDAAYIAAMHPGTVIALLDAVEAMAGWAAGLGNGFTKEEILDKHGIGGTDDD